MNISSVTLKGTSNQIKKAKNETIWTSHKVSTAKVFNIKHVKLTSWVQFNT